MPLLVSCSSLSRYQQFKDFQRRILVATNLFGRGMDIERVNIVFNYDMPEDSDTYLHRVSASSQHVWAQGLPHPSSDPKEYLSPDTISLQVARAGRFGTKGLAVTFVSDENDAKILNDVQDRFEVNVAELPEEIDISTYSKCLGPLWAEELGLRSKGPLSVLTATFLSLQSSRAGNHVCSQGTWLSLLLLQILLLGGKSAASLFIVPKL